MYEMNYESLIGHSLVDIKVIKLESLSRLVKGQ